MKLTSLFAAAAATLVLAAPAAVAGEYDVSGAGTYIFDSADSDLSFTAATVRGAYWFNETIGAELEYSTGLGGTDNYAGSGVNFDLSSQIGAYLVGRFTSGQSGEFFGRVGFRDGTLDVSGNTTGEADYNGFSIGGGYTYFVNENLGLRGEVTTSGASLDSNLDPDGNLTSFSLGLLYRFGK